MGSRAVDLRTLVSLVRGLPRNGTHAERLEAFYGPQAAHYDSFRERLLAGRRELIAMLELPAGAHVVELGAGTGQNLDYIGKALGGLRRVELVDLCPSLLAQARRRAADLPNVHVVEANAATYRPDGPVDCVYMSYALTMMPNWASVIDNALAMLRPGGMLGVVDFYVGAAGPMPGDARHGLFTRHFWPRWFAHDGVFLSPEPFTYLRARLPVNRRYERRAPVPYLPWLRVPYYQFTARRP